MTLWNGGLPSRSVMLKATGVCSAAYQRSGVYPPSGHIDTSFYFRERKLVMGPMQPPHPDLLVDGRGHAENEDQLEPLTTDDQTPRYLDYHLNYGDPRSTARVSAVRYFMLFILATTS
ncbi:hypothetical protein CIB48_g9442 [Xylaria polymorpha]|nr:hypothetical protein CIB48_g9442 [Xylaria polymorpha]